MERAANLLHELSTARSQRAVLNLWSKFAARSIEVNVEKKSQTNVNQLRLKIFFFTFPLYGRDRAVLRPDLALLLTMF